MCQVFSPVCEGWTWVNTAQQPNICVLKGSMENRMTWNNTISGKYPCRGTKSLTATEITSNTFILETASIKSNAKSKYIYILFLDKQSFHYFTLHLPVLKLKKYLLSYPLLDDTCAEFDIDYGVSKYRIIKMDAVYSYFQCCK